MTRLPPFLQTLLMIMGALATIGGGMTAFDQLRIFPLRSEFERAAHDLYEMKLERLEFRLGFAKRDEEACTERCFGERARVREIERDIEETRRLLERYTE